MAFKQWLKNQIFGRVTYQRFFRKLQDIALEGQNIGTSGTLDNDGEKWAIQYVRRSLSHKNSLTIFDVGANVGDWTKEAQNIASTTYSFEPSNKAFELLKKNIGGEHLYNIALSDRTGEETLFTNESGSGLASLYPRNLKHFGIDFKKTEVISTQTLDNFCAQNKINQIDFLKIDVEGHDKKVLDGAQQMIKEGKIYFIQFEFGGADIDSRTFFQDFWYLLSSQYKISRILKDGLAPINKYRESEEVFLNTNFLAELKIK